MSDISPARILKDVANSIPSEFHELIVVVGSLAAGFHYFGNNEEKEVRTKDIDCVVSPRVKAVAAGEIITEHLLKDGWEPISHGGRTFPAPPQTPDAELPAIRLYPPGHRGWFLEFLTVPDPANENNRQWMRVKLKEGHAGLASFQYLSLTDFEPLPTGYGIYYAQPATMALANLLSHQKIGPETMSTGIGGREIKRSNKDLGRVLAMARLGDEELDSWPRIWFDSLKSRFPEQFDSLAPIVGDGLRALLASENDLEQAVHTCNHGLLVDDQVKVSELKPTGKRFLQDVVDVFEQLATSSKRTDRN
jgi:hypothetical protein